MASHGVDPGGWFVPLPCTFIVECQHYLVSVSREVRGMATSYSYMRSSPPKSSLEEGIMVRFFRAVKTFPQ